MMRTTTMRSAAAMALSLLLVAPQTACSQSNKPAAAPAAPAKAGLTMERSEGTSIQTILSSSIVLNRGSGLKREWFVVRDTGSPAAIEGNAGATVIYKSG